MVDIMQNYMARIASHIDVFIGLHSRLQSVYYESASDHL